MSNIDQELNNKDCLPFSKKPQDAVLGYQLIDRQFFLFCKDKIQAKWFLSAINGKIFNALRDFYDKFQEFPSVEQLLEWPSIATEEQELKNKINHTIKISIATTAEYSKQWIEERLQQWLQAHLFTEHMEKAAYLYNKGNFNEAFNEARIGMRKVDTVVFDPNKEYDPTNWQVDFKESEAEYDNALTFGCDVIDQKLNPMAKSGSLLLGDTTVLLAPLNIGKTTALITTLCHNLKNDKDVLFITHEGRPEDIRDKLWMNLLGMTREELYVFTARASSDPNVMEQLVNFSKWLKEHLTYLPMNKAGLSVEEVDTVVRQKFDEKRQRTGKGFDLIADDYPAKLTTIRNSKGHLEKRHEDSISYNYFVQLALEFKAHSLVAIQSNREGSRVNQGQKGEGRLLTPEDVSEAFGPVQVATNIITINRNPAAQAKKMLTYYLAKSRSSEIGYAIVCKTDYAKAMTHSNLLGATWYRGTSNLTDSERIDDFMSQFKDKEIPLSAMLDAGIKD